MSERRPRAGPTIVWFRDDLRLGDNPALHAALETGGPVLPVFILDETSTGLRPLGGAARWWLHHSLASLGKRIADLGGELALFRGEAVPILAELSARVGATACLFNRRYGAAERAVDADALARVREAGIAVQTFNGRLLHEPEEVRSKTGGPFKVFTPFLKASLALGDPGRPLPAPRALQGALIRGEMPARVALTDLDLLPTKPDWAGGLRDTWTPGEPEAQRLMHSFLETGLSHYADDRNKPALAASSRLSPHLRFGEISPRQVFARARHAGAEGTANPDQVEKFIAEVIWRDFSYNLLVQHPDIATVPVQHGFENFPYEEVAPSMLQAWRRGSTGYPIVDAGMRQLWHTGVMHNRVRMITASFLVKHLLADWRIGERWFWDTLCDADPASNAVNWQWVAGSGADPAPYFRIFNPTRQGETFDPDGAYVRAHVPELARLPKAWVHEPWRAPKAVLEHAGVRIGTTYPAPIVDHEESRRRALAAFAAMRDSRETAPSH